MMKSKYHVPVRLGVAPIEFLMFLPVIIAFSVLTMHVIRVHEAKQRATLNAEILAVEQRVIVDQQKRLATQPSYRGSDSADLAQLVTAFQKISDIKSGIVMGRSEVDSGEGVPGIAKPAGVARTEIGFLSHAWEADFMPFPTQRAEQSPLTLPECVRGIAQDLGDLKRFAQLAALSGAASGGFSGSAEQLATSQQAAVQIAKRELEKLNKSISEMERKLNQLNLNPSENESEIREIEKRLRQARSYRDRIADALRKV